jgi:tannase/feruloyl esterase
MLFERHGQRSVKPISGLHLACATASGLLALASVGVERSVAGTPASCESLSSFHFADTTINSAMSQSGGPYVAADAWHLAFANLPPYCEVYATIKPTADSSINVRVWMPTQRYNGRYLGTGNGGYAGGFFFSELADGINRGFATANTDMGTAPAAGVNADALVGHPEKWKDFGWRATHLMTTFSKALINAFYGNPAQRNYFAGCSTGGQQALMEMQRYPDEYDGVLAGAPAFNRTHLHTILVSEYRATHRTAQSYIPPTKLDLVNKAVLAQCNRQDGGAPSDPFLTDPRDCQFDPAQLQCPIGDGPNCLNADQVAAMKVYYKGSTNLATGAVIAPGNARGSETSSPAALGFALNESSTEPTFDSLFKWVFGLTWQWQTFDFNKDMASVDRVLASDLNANNADLRQFASRGGKLVMYHGFADPLIPSQTSINYYNALVESSSGTVSAKTIAQTQKFARLFMAPGMWHCKDGPGPNSFGGPIQQQAPSYDPQYDLMSALVQWVEKGTAPASVTATKYNGDLQQGGIVMQRPLCPYPQFAKYNGTGNPNLPTSFKCVADDRAKDFNEKPAAIYGP